MNKFVFLSFIVMGWAFFELSGGKDFKPRVNPESKVTASTPLAIPEPDEPVEIETTALILPSSQTPVDSKVTVTDISSAPVPEDPKPVLQVPVDLTKKPPVTLVSLEKNGNEFGGLLAEFDPNAIRLSTTVTNETTNPTPEVTSEPELPPIDLRTISANHVNMRNGPGTTYDVVTRLKLGEEVEVLGDSGSGWLRLRLVSNRTVGWISASLVSKPLR